MHSAVIYRGPSLLTGEAIVATVTRHDSANRTTGAVASVYVLPAVTTAKADRPHPSVCPARCPFRDTGGCYVNWSQAPAGVQRATKGERPVVADVARAIAAGRVVRLAQAGDPAAVPVRVWRNLLADSAGWLGYTHSLRPSLRRICMASVESEAEAVRLRAAGWRTFRCRPDGTGPMANEIVCPAESGQSTCVRCGLCSGADGKGAGAPNITKAAHGGAVARRVAQAIVGAL